MVALSRKLINYLPINSKYLLEKLRHEEMGQLGHEGDQMTAEDGGVEVCISKYSSKSLAASEDSVAGVVCLKGETGAVAKWKNKVWNCMYQVKHSPLSLAGSPILKELDEVGSLSTEQPISMIHLTLPIHLALQMSGLNGQKSMKVLLKEGILTSISSRIVESKDSTVSIAVIGVSDPASPMENEATTDNLVYRKILGERLRMDWLLTRHCTEISRILHRFNVIMIREENGLLLVGLEADLVEDAGCKVEKLLYTGHLVSLRFRHNNKLEATMMDDLHHICQQSGVEVMVEVGAGVIHLMGSYQCLRQALSLVPYYVDQQPQIHYRLIDHEEVREFVSGKKDGKLIKIMKETGVCMSLRAVEELGRIEFELVGGEVERVLTALDMLMGEFPAECSFFLEESYHKRLIGHGGKNIQKIMKKHAVYIKFLTMDEAIQMKGADVNYCYSEFMATRLPNVLIRTPAKNEMALPYAKIDILEMAEEVPHDLETIQLTWPLEAIIKATPPQRLKLADIFDVYGDTVMMTMDQRDEDDQIHLRLVGTTESLHQIEVEISMLTWLNCQSSLFTPMASPSLSAASTTSSSLSACDPNKLRPWNCSLLLSPTLLPSTITMLGESSILATPELPMLNRHISMPTSPQMSTITGASEGFNSCVGAQLKKKKGPWEMNFPRLSLMTPDCARIGREDEISQQMDWRAIIAESFRRRASLLINN